MILLIQLKIIFIGVLPEDDDFAVLCRIRAAYLNPGNSWLTYWANKFVFFIVQPVCSQVTSKNQNHTKISADTTLWRTLCMYYQTSGREHPPAGKSKVFSSPSGSSRST